MKFKIWIIQIIHDNGSLTTQTSLLTNHFLAVYVYISRLFNPLSQSTKGGGSRSVFSCSMAPGSFGEGSGNLKGSGNLWKFENLGRVWGLGGFRRDLFWR